MITSLGEEGAGLCAFRALCLFILHALMFVVFLFLWCEGLAADSDCGTLWSFLLTFYGND